MTDSSPLALLGAALTVTVAVLAAAVIAFGFLAPEEMLDTVGVLGFFLAVAVMVGCAVVANVYDLRGILADALG